MPAASDALRIAQVAPLLETVPPSEYGGTERVIYGLTEHLVRLGHDVTLFAAGGSRTSAKLVAAAPAPFRCSMTRQAAHAGFQVEVLGDATGTLSYGNTAGRASAQQIHTATLATLHAAIGAVGTTDEWIAALGGDPLPAGDLIASTRAGAAA